MKIGSHRTREIPNLKFPPFKFVYVPFLCPGENDDENNSFLKWRVVEKRFQFFGGGDQVNNWNGMER